MMSASISEYSTLEDVPSAAATAMSEGICSAFVSSFLLCVTIVRIDSTMTTRLTEPILVEINKTTRLQCANLLTENLCIHG